MTTPSSGAGGSGTAPPSSDNSADLVNDLMNGKPILSKLYEAMASDDDNATMNVLSANGYNITAEGVSKILSTASPGPNFDPRMGKLEFPLSMS
jgi:hypothetical protein